MKMLLSLTLLSLLFSPALSLECYVCSPSANNKACNMKTQECQKPLDTCMTIVDILGSDKAILKQCVSQATCNRIATSASFNSYGNGNIVNCCNSFLCNFSGAESVHIHIKMLLLVTACVFLLLSH